jgi:hypothetical protein
MYEGRGDPLQILQFEQTYRYSECPQILRVRSDDYRRGGHHLALKFKSESRPHLGLYLTPGTVFCQPRARTSSCATSDKRRNSGFCTSIIL